MLPTLQPRHLSITSPVLSTVKCWLNANPRLERPALDVGTFDARRLMLNARMIHDTLQDGILVQQIHVEMLKYSSV
jgi:hypothetical protein